MTLSSRFRTRAFAGLLFLLLFFVYYSLHGSRISPEHDSPNRYYLLTGDEPHYLLMAHSLAFDGDMDLHNNLRQEDYRAFYNRPVSGYIKSKEWILARVSSLSTLHQKPEEYWTLRALPTQPIGTAALIAPVYKLGFHWGQRIRFCMALFFHAMLAALVLVMIELCWRFTGNRLTSAFIGVGAGLSGPLLFYSFPIYPDLPGAALIALGVLMLARMQDEGHNASHVRAAALGICSAALPWVHLRFWPMSFIFVVAVCWPTTRWRLSRSVLVAFLFPWILSLVGLARYYLMLFGTPWPASTAPPFSFLIGLRSGWPGLLMDPNMGLFFYLPLAIFAIPGLIYLVRLKSRTGLTVTVLLITYFGLVGANEGWHGGMSPPLRYWVPVIPLVAVAISVALTDTRARGVKVVACLLGAWGPPVAVWGMLHARNMYSYHHVYLARSRWANWWDNIPVFFPQPSRWSLCLSICGWVTLTLVTMWTMRKAGLDQTSG